MAKVPRSDDCGDLRRIAVYRRDLGAVYGALHNIGVLDARGRWPANVVHDGSDAVSAAFPQASGQQGAVTGNEKSRITKTVYGAFSGDRLPSQPRGDGGSASRFFYSAKASAAERSGSKHPTVKPVALMRWLCRLVAPPGALILDPFAGSGTTGVAAVQEGQSAILIERQAEFCNDIAKRVSAA